MKRIAILSFVLLAACENPDLFLGASISSSGEVTPSVSGRSGNVSVAVSG